MTAGKNFHWSIQRSMNEQVVEGKIANRSKTSSGGNAEREPRRGKEPLMHPLTAEQGEDLEESRAYRFSRHCDPRGMNQRSCFHTSRLCDQPQSFLDRRGVELGKLGARGVERHEM